MPRLACSVRHPRLVTTHRTSTFFCLKETCISFLRDNALSFTKQSGGVCYCSVMQVHKGLQPCCFLGQPFISKAQFSRRKGLSLQPQQQKCRTPGRVTPCRICCSAQRQSTENIAAATISSSFVLWLLSELPALAEKKDFSQGGGFAKESYYVTLGLFLLSLPGTLSLPLLSCWCPRQGLCKPYEVYEIIL